MIVKNIPIKQLKYNNTNDVKRIYHLADIHIRLDLRRHNEYKIVFNRLYEYLKNEKDGIIVVCGDILHSKNELSPEVVQMTINFFKNLGNIMDVFIIMGNHDVNLSNKNKLDSLTPLLSEINCKNNVHYLKDTGIYIYKNISFSVISIIDNRFIKASEVKNNKVKIALFHGAVHGAETDVGHRMNDTEYVVNDFDGYDYVLLGDIHKFQYLDEKKRICYSSSLIQQSYGEKIDYHGLVKWNLKKGTSKFVNIKNDYGFLTFKVYNGEIVELPKNIPLKPRIRLLLENTNRYQYLKICEELKKKYDIQEITSSFITNDKKGGEIRENENLKINIDSIKYQNRLMKEYINKNFDIEKKKIKKILRLNKEINKEIIKKEIINSNRWRLKYLRFSNMFSYGEDNHINFDKLRGIVGVFAPNFYGKSSILDIIQFCLFDRCSRGIRTEILNYKKDYLECELTLEINGVDYKIIREGKKKKRHAKTIRIDVWFWKVNDSKKDWVLLNGKDRHETNKIITKYIGTYEDFIMTSLKLQKDMNFIDYPQCKKKDFLIKLLKLNIFEDLSKISKDRLKEVLAIYNDLMIDIKKKNLENEIKELNKSKDILKEKINEKESKKKLIKSLYNSISKYSLKIKDVEKTNFRDIVEIKNDILENKNKNEELKNYLLKINKELDEKKNNLIKIDNEFSKEEITNIKNMYNKDMKKNKDEIENLNNNINDLYSQLKEINNKEFDVNELKKKKENLKNNILIFEDNSNNLINELKKMREKLIVIGKDTKTKIRKNYEEYNKNINSFELSMDELKNIDSNLIIMKEKLNKLSKHKYDPNCKFCVNNIFVKDARNTRFIYNKLNLNKCKSILERDIIYRKIKFNFKNKRKYIDLIKKEENNTNYLTKSYNFESRISNINKDIIIEKNKYDNNENKINEYNKSKKNLEYNKNLKIKIEKNNIKINELKNYKNSQYNRIIKNELEISNYKTLIKDLTFNISITKKEVIEQEHILKDLNNELKNNEMINMQIKKNNENKITINNLKKKRK